MTRESLKSATTPSNKQEWRAVLRAQRAAISSHRREKAAEALLETLTPLLSSCARVLSFCSLPQEIDTTHVNAYLEAHNKLLLPKIRGTTLEIYRITRCAEELREGLWQVREPRSDLCTLASLDEVACVLIPGLGFDTNKMRIGYGKGHYDRWIAELKKLTSPPPLIGIGFQEQLVATALPVEPHDAPLDQLILI